MSDIPPVVEGVLWDIPRGPKAQGVYHHKPPNSISLIGHGSYVIYYVEY